jgi:hypothetical protein
VGAGVSQRKRPAHGIGLSTCTVAREIQIALHATGKITPSWGPAGATEASGQPRVG